jgi:hypothetical protein
VVLPGESLGISGRAPRMRFAWERFEVEKSNRVPSPEYDG